VIRVYRQGAEQTILENARAAKGVTAGRAGYTGWWAGAGEGGLVVQMLMLRPSLTPKMASYRNY